MADAVRELTIKIKHEEVEKLRLLVEQVNCFTAPSYFNMYWCCLYKLKYRHSHNNEMFHIHEILADST
jgi:hypothetical protein